MTNTERTASGIHVTFDGSAGEVVEQIGALMANVAETYGMVKVLSNSEGQTREDAENVLIQAMIDNATGRLNRKRAEREKMS